jgi:hypothetical protein
MPELKPQKVNIGFNKRMVGFAMKTQTFLLVAIQTVGKYGTDVHTPIQTVIQTVVKNSTDVQTVED